MDLALTDLSGYQFDGFAKTAWARNNVTGLHVNIKDVYAAPRFTHELIRQLTPTASITNWTDQFGEFFQAIKLEKTVNDVSHFIANTCSRSI